MKLRITAAEEYALFEAASAAMKNAYVPVNGICVGSSVLSTSGRIFPGCNTQSVISGLGSCAERNAINNAVVSGEYCFTAIGITSSFLNPISPCGMCLQYMGEFAQVGETDILIIMFGSKAEPKRSSVKKLLHSVVGPVELGLDLSKYRKKG